MNNQKNYKFSLSALNRDTVTYYREKMFVWESSPRKCHFIRVNRLNNLIKNR